ncbi:purine-nucleoside phosphorylase [Brucepastera parasyntrophica]|uniref:purine-nucleoside phosphorylase n=1 Tax=Brucepastera parasyntrophica TaxID=2880008 RepID=UPI00210C4638|nr:purine-nucleoside phosphorylase [Brucepastera parasyntrophica]ULQ60202.1 purine-nucleoside phosphorylase [Brucepastera parasyntrophica]
MPTPHNSAQNDEIAPIVLFPGDPLRAKHVADSFLSDVKKVTSVRNMLGYTGTWKNVPVSVIASGMGCASAGIYSYELFRFYDVQNIIRIGTAGGLQEYIEPGDFVFAMTASSDSNYAYQYSLPGTYAPCADFGLFEKAVSIAKKKKLVFHAGGVFSSDLFSDYNALGPQTAWVPWSRMGCLAQDMETFALYCNAAWLEKKALSILTHTDSCVTGKFLAVKERKAAIDTMISVALDLVADISKGKNK